MKNESDIRYYSTLTLFLTAGMILRLWHWPTQFFLDDEWHAFGFVMNRSFKEVVFQHGMGANSIPVNIWFWLTLHTVGWSEIILRLPSMLAGFLSLLILPLLVRRLWGTTVSLTFTALLAASPIVIFYTRIVRPFSPAMLFGTASVLLTLLWIREGRRLELFVSVISGFLAVYYHLYSVIPVVVPMLVAACTAIPAVAVKFKLAPRPWVDTLAAALLFMLLGSIFIVTPNVLNPWWQNFQGMSHANFDTLLTFVEFIAGTARLGLSYAVFLLVPLGCLLLIRRSLIEGIAFTLPIVLFITVMANYTQDGAHAGIQAARYGIAFFPFSFIAIAISLEAGLNLLQSRFSRIRCGATAAIYSVIWLPFLLTSPLWELYRWPNNFTSHSAYQYHYTPRTWEQSPERDLAAGISLRFDEIPSVYRMQNILLGRKGIIEYPVAVGDHVNLLYYYQRFHKLPVVAGYIRKDFSPRYPARAEWTYADKMYDYVMTGLSPQLIHQADSWKSMVNIEDIARLRTRYRDWLIVLHRNPIREVCEHIPELGTLEGASPDLPLTPFVTEMLAKNFGEPIMASNHVIVWVIK